MKSVWRRRRYELLSVVLLVLLVSPVLRLAELHQRWVVLLILSILIAAALNAVSAGPRMRRAVILSATIAFVAGWLEFAKSTSLAAYIQHGSAAVFFGLVAALILRDVLAAGRISAERIMAAICVYFVFALFWAALYSCLLVSDPTAIRSAGELDQHAVTYFSLVTLTTLGYGDIVPVLPLARALAVLEAATGVLYLATLVARLVALQIVHSGAKVGRQDDDPPQNVSS